jgi:hypothetical protein
LHISIIWFEIMKLFRTNIRKVLLITNILIQRTE